MQKKSKEDLLDMKLEDYKMDLFHFINALLNCGVYWKDCSQEIYKNDLLVHEGKVYNKRKKKREKVTIIPDKKAFWNALRKCGIDRKYFNAEITISEIEAMDVLNRAKVIEKYNKIYSQETNNGKIDKDNVPNVILFNDDAVLEVEMMGDFDPEKYYKYL